MLVKAYRSPFNDDEDFGMDDSDLIPEDFEEHFEEDDFEGSFDEELDEFDIDVDELSGFESDDFDFEDEDFEEHFDDDIDL